MKKLTTVLLVVLALITAAQLAVANITTVAGGPGDPDAPPATLGPYTMTPFADDTRGFIQVTSVDSPLGGVVSFDTPVMLLPGGPAYYSYWYWVETLNSPIDTVTLTLPADTIAFYFYATQNQNAGSITAVSQDGTELSQVVGLVNQTLPTYFGFWADGADTIQTITISSRRHPLLEQLHNW